MTKSLSRRRLTTEVVARARGGINCVIFEEHERRKSKHGNESRRSEVDTDTQWREIEGH